MSIIPDGQFNRILFVLEKDLHFASPRMFENVIQGFLRDTIDCHLHVRRQHALSCRACGNGIRRKQGAPWRIYAG